MKMTNTQATNYLIAQLTGDCEPLEAGTEVRESGDDLIVTLPEEDEKGNVTMAEFVVTIKRRTP